MTVLEFIRKNSLLVLIVIVALFVGLVMMDYSGKGSLFTKDYYFKVNGTGYEFSEAQNLGANAGHHIHSIYTGTVGKLQKRFDTNKDGTLDAEEMQERQAWLAAHPECEQFLNRLDIINRLWCGVGVSTSAEDNMAINRAVLHEEAKIMGLKPSKEQVDAYIRKMPLFQNEDGSFDQALYQQLTGFRNGTANSSYEQSFRSVIEDIMIWEALENVLTQDAFYNIRSMERLTDIHLQTFSGRTAWLPVPTAKPEPPTEEEVKKYWEAHKSAYKTQERRIVTVYTYTIAEGGNTNDLQVVAKEVSSAKSSGTISPAKIFEATKNDPEKPAFTYEAKQVGPCTKEELTAQLDLKVSDGGNEVSLTDIAFRTNGKAPSIADYGKAKAEGKATGVVNAGQVSDSYAPEDENEQYEVIVQVDAVDAPRELTFEEAKEQATKDLATEMEHNALKNAAEKMYAEMTEALKQSPDAAFKKAEEAGATVSAFGPVTPSMKDEPLEDGMDVQTLMQAGKNTLLPLVILPNGARVSMVETRTVENSIITQMYRAQYIHFSEAVLRQSIMEDFLRSAYQRLKVEPSEHIKRESN